MYLDDFYFSTKKIIKKEHIELLNESEQLTDFFDFYNETNPLNQIEFRYENEECHHENLENALQKLFTTLTSLGYKPECFGKYFIYGGYEEFKGYIRSEIDQNKISFYDYDIHNDMVFIKNNPIPIKTDELIKKLKNTTNTRKLKKIIKSIIG